MNKSLKTLSFVAVGLVLVWICYGFYQAFEPKPILIQGQIIAQQYSVASMVPGRIEKVYVNEGDSVRQDQLIFTLSASVLDAKRDQAQAGHNAAAAMAKEAENGARKQQLQAANDQWQKALTAERLYQKTYQRVNNLFNDGVVSEQKRDEVYAKWQAAKLTQNAAYQLYNMAKEGAPKTLKKAAVEKANMAQGAVDEVNAYLSETTIKSAFNGEVAQVLLHQGELAPQGFPVVTIIDNKNAWLSLIVREDHLSHFTKGSQFDAFIPALNQRLTFTVTHLSAMGDFATWRATNATTGFDLRSFEIDAKPTTPTDALRMGMSAVVSL